MGNIMSRTPIAESDQSDQRLGLQASTTWATTAEDRESRSRTALLDARVDTLS